MKFLELNFYANSKFSLKIWNKVFFCFRNELLKIKNTEIQTFHIEKQGFTFLYWSDSASDLQI